MVKSKDVRKYGSMLYCLRWLVYILHHIALLPVKLSALVVFALAAACLIVSSAVLLASATGFPADPSQMLTAILASSAVMGISGWFLHYVRVEVPRGHILHPTPPTEN